MTSITCRRNGSLVGRTGTRRRVGGIVLLTVLAIAVVAVLTSVSLASEKPVKRYGIESGVIIARTEGMNGLHKGTEETYFDRWGMREAKYADVELMGERQHTLTLVDGRDMYTVNLQNRVGRKEVTPYYDDLVAQAGSKDWQDVSRMMLEQMGGEKVGTETLLDSLDCDKWKLSHIDATVWVWKGIVLKTHLRLAGTNMLIEATEVRFGDVPEEKLTLPSGLTLTDAPAQPGPPR